MRILITALLKLLQLARLIFNKAVVMLAVSLMLAQHAWAMVEMKDEQLANVTGQALMQMNKIVGDNGANGTQGMTFYTAGLDVMLDLNLNIEKLQLGCGGVNGVGCDLDIDHFSLGCITNGAGNCISLSPAAGSNQKPGAVNEGPQSGMKDFSLQRPYFQFAIKNDQSKTLREVIGIRLGAEQSSGPLSFGSLNTFSGYMSGMANLTMQGETDVSPTCRSPDTCPNNDGRSIYTDASAYLGLNNSTVLDFGFLASVDYKHLTVNYGQGKDGNPSEITRNNLAVALAGNRQDQALISGLGLGGVVDDIIYGSATTSELTLARRDIQGLFGWAANGFADQLLPLLRDGVAEYIKLQLAQGLGYGGSSSATAVNNWLNAYSLPYNLSNVHQLDISSPTFGLSFQKEGLAYPGYADEVATGWAMYAPDAFVLDINDKVSTLVQNIAGNTNARDGNIVGLEAPYRNCWGSSRFC